MTIVPFRFNRLQRQLWAWLLADLKAGKPIRWDILKGRQIGSSTFSVLCFFWLASMNKAREALIVAHDLKSAVQLHEMTKLAYASMPTWIRPMQKTSNRRELFFDNPDPKGEMGLRSKISVDTCENSDLGASQTLHLVLLSEIARYETVQDPSTIMTSLNPSIPFIPGTVIIRESTAKGAGYWKDQWYNISSEYKKIFTSYLAEDKYRLEIPVSDYPILSEVDKSFYGNEVQQYANIYAELKIWYPEYTEGQLVHETMCRVAWRRWAIDNLCEKDKNYFSQEYPATPAEAFLGSGDAVFDEPSLVEMAKHAHNMPCGRHTYDIGAINNYGQSWDKYCFPRAEGGNLRVYEEPTSDGIYVIGADPSYGIEDEDKAAAVVLKIPTLVQVASYNQSISPDFFGDLLYALGTYYNHALLGVEVNGPGISTINRLWHVLSYNNLYYREARPDQISRIRDDQLGWFTDKVSKAVMMTEAKKQVIMRTAYVVDPDTNEQLREYKRMKGDKFGAPPGKKDDLAIAFMIAIQMAIQTHIPLKKEEEIKIPRFSPAWIIKNVLQRKDRNYGKINVA